MIAMQALTIKFIYIFHIHISTFLHRSKAGGGLTALGVFYVGMLISDWSTYRSTSRAKTKGRPIGRPIGMLITERSARDRFGRPSNKCWCAPAESRTLQLFCYQFSFQLIRC